MWRKKTTTAQKRERKKSNLTIHISSGSCWCNFEGSNEIRREYLPWNTLINFILSSSDAPNNRSASNGWQSSNNPSSKLIRSERAFWRPFPKPMMEDIIDQINNWQPFLEPCFLVLCCSPKPVCNDQDVLGPCDDPILHNFDAVLCWGGDCLHQSRELHLLFHSHRCSHQWWRLLRPRWRWNWRMCLRPKIKDAPFVIGMGRIDWGRRALGLGCWVVADHKPNKCFDHGSHIRRRCWRTCNGHLAGKNEDWWRLIWWCVIIWRDWLTRSCRRANRHCLSIIHADLSSVDDFPIHSCFRALCRVDGRENWQTRMSCVEELANNLNASKWLKMLLWSLLVLFLDECSQSTDFFVTGPFSSNGSVFAHPILIVCLWRNASLPPCMVSCARIAASSSSNLMNPHSSSLQWVSRSPLARLLKKIFLSVHPLSCLDVIILQLKAISLVPFLLQILVVVVVSSFVPLLVTMQRVASWQLFDLWKLKKHLLVVLLLLLLVVVLPS